MMPLEDEIVGESLDLIGAISIAFSVIVASLGFAHWLGKKLQKLGDGLDHYAERNHDDHMVIKEGMAETTEKLEAINDGQQDIRERVVAVETKVNVMCNGEED